MPLKQKSLKLHFFFSGGRDSTLIGKILVDSGVTVHAYHVSRYLLRGQERKKNLQSLENLASKIGFADLNIVDGGLDLESTDVVFKSRATGSPLYAGLAKLISETDVLSRESLWFGQGADTLSCTVSTQRNAYETLVKRLQKKNRGMGHGIGVENSLFLFSELFSNQFRRKNRIIAAPLASHVAKEFLKSVPKVLNFSKRAQLIIAGMHLTHGLTDSEPFYRLADLGSKKVFNPFHDRRTEDIFLSFIECEQDRINWNKNEKVLIEEALNALQIDSSRLTSKGFYVETPHTKFHNHRDVFAWRKKSFENCN